MKIEQLGIHIVAAGRALPKKVVSNEDLSHIVETNDEWIRTRTGICQRYICEEESCQSLAIEAAKKVLQKTEINREEIGAVVVATTTADYVFPSVACMVQNALELSTEVISFDLSAACSGFLYGLEVCRGLLLTGRKKYALLIGCEQLSRITDFKDRTTCVLFGDGAGAVVLELSDALFTHRAWSEGNADALSCRGVGYSEAYIKMDGSSVFKFAVKVIKEGIDAVLEDAGLTMEQIDFVVCHQANQRIIQHMQKQYRGCENKFYINIGKYGNTSAASIPIALDEMMEEGLLKSGMRIICVGFGAGFTWSSALITV
ncbi:MAG: beta-ketoacyl-ACP synthase III [Lachnospiraceae bacterium]